MKKLFYQESIENKISYFHLLCFLVVLPFDRFYSTMVLISFLIHSIFHFRRERLPAIDKKVFILQSVFYVSVLAATYASSFNTALNIITKQLAIFLFPLLLATASIDLEKYRHALLEGFAVCCSLVVAYLYVDAIRDIRYNHLPMKTLFSPAFIHHNFSMPIELHATYFSLFISISFVYLLQQILQGISRTKTIFFTCCLVILSAGLTQLSSKSAFISLFIIINIAVPWFVYKGKRAFRFLFASLTISALLIMVVLSVDVFRERLFTDLKKDLVKVSESENETWRIYRWDAAVDLIKNSPVIGHGTGSEIPMLKSLYFERRMYAAYLGSLNVHNQYLSFLINSGMIGLLVYLGTLCWGFWQAAITRNLLLFSFLTLVAVVSFSEDILDVNKGIFFYGFFFSFFTLPGKAGKA